MSIDLPQAIVRYFAAENLGDAAVFEQCFTPRSVARDEGKIMSPEIHP
jgi:hypothetical protein